MVDFNKTTILLVLVGYERNSKPRARQIVGVLVASNVSPLPASSPNSQGEETADISDLPSLASYRLISHALSWNNDPIMAKMEFILSFYCAAIYWVCCLDDDVGWSIC